MLVAIVGVESPQALPIVGREILLPSVRPGDIVSAVIGWQIQAIGSVVSGDDDAEAVENVIFLQILFVSSQHVRRCGGVDLDVVVEFEAVEIAKIARFVDS